jgi:hypothetical protein
MLLEGRIPISRNNIMAIKAWVWGFVGDSPGIVWHMLADGVRSQRFLF